MWWRILTFCLLVTVILFAVLSCIQGRPVINFFFHRCCEENIENDQGLFENFGNGFLKERLIGGVIEDNTTYLEEESEMIEALKRELNVHDPGSRINLDIEDFENSNEKNIEPLESASDTDSAKSFKNVQVTLKDFLDLPNESKINSVNKVMSKESTDISENFTSAGQELKELMQEMKSFTFKDMPLHMNTNNNIIDRNIEVTTEGESVKH